MTGRRRAGRRLHGEGGAIPFVLVGIVALGGVLGAAWAGHEWSQSLLGEAGGELTVWVLRGAFWALDLVALQASMSPVNTDWYTPVLTGPALPLYALAALVVVGTLLAEVIAGIAQGNTTRIVQAVFRALLAGMLATIAATVLLSLAGALSEVGRAALAASGTTVDAPLIPLQEVLMESAEDRDGAGVELFIAFLAAVVIVFTSVSIYFILAMRPVVLAAIIVFLPIAHALSVWEPMRRVQLRVWSLAVAVLLAEAAILTMFAVTNTAMGQPQGVDRLIFGTFGLLLAALAPAALARIVGAPELHSAVSTMSRGSKALAIGGGLLAFKGARSAMGGAGSAAAAGGMGGSALEATGPGGGGGGPAGGGSGPSGGPSGPSGPAPAAGGGGGGAAGRTATTAGSSGATAGAAGRSTGAAATSTGAATAATAAGASSGSGRTATTAAAGAGAVGGGGSGSVSGGADGQATGTSSTASGRHLTAVPSASAALSHPGSGSGRAQAGSGAAGAGAGSALQPAGRSTGTAADGPPSGAPTGGRDEGSSPAASQPALRASRAPGGAGPGGQPSTPPAAGSGSGQNGDRGAAAPVGWSSALQSQRREVGRG